MSAVLKHPSVEGVLAIHSEVLAALFIVHGSIVEFAPRGGVQDAFHD